MFARFVLAEQAAVAAGMAAITAMAMRAAAAASCPAALAAVSSLCCARMFSAPQPRPDRCQADIVFAVAQAVVRSMVNHLLVARAPRRFAG